MVNYSKGKIYCIVPIVEHDEGDVYIGSTAKFYLSQRMDTHRSNYQKWRVGYVKYTTTSFNLFDKYGVGNCKIVLLESVDAKSKDELLAREAHYIKTMKCINKVIPLRTRQQYKEDNKERITEYRLSIKEQTRLKDQEYRDKNKELLKIKSKQYYEKNKELIKLKQQLKKEINLVVGDK